MPDFDIKYDTTPQNLLTGARGPSIAAMKSALSTVNGGASYTPARLQTMTRLDLRSACRYHGLSVNGL